MRAYQKVQNAPKDGQEALRARQVRLNITFPRENHGVGGIRIAGPNGTPIWVILQVFGQL